MITSGVSLRDYQREALGRFLDIDREKAELDRIRDEAARIIAHAERRGNQRADEVFGERTRLLVDREARVGVREREVANALQPYREARSRMLAALDGVEKIPVLVTKLGKA